MNELKLIIEGGGVTRAAVLSENRPGIRIGSVSDCDIRLKRELFDGPVLVTVCFSGDGWRISCEEGAALISRTGKEASEFGVLHGDIFSLRQGGSDVLKFYTYFSYPDPAPDYDAIIDIRDLSPVVIGNTDGAHIKLDSDIISGEYIVLSNDDGEISADASFAPNSALLNGERFFGIAKISDFDFISLGDFIFYFKNGVLYTPEREDLSVASGLDYMPLREETPAYRYPELNRGPRLKKDLGDEPIEIAGPPKKPDAPKTSLILQLSPTLAMIAVSALSQASLIGSGVKGAGLVISNFSTLAVGILTTVFGFAHGRLTYRSSLKKWENGYREIILKKTAELEDEKFREQTELWHIYPDCESLREFVKTFSGRIFERSPADDDFLSLSLGTGSNPAMRKPVFKPVDHSGAESEMTALAKSVCEKYSEVDGTPVRVDLRASGTIGVIGDEEKRYEFFKTLLAQVCILHSYEDVKVILMIPSGETDKYGWVKWFPHLNGVGGELRGIVCDRESRDRVFEYLYSVMSERKSALESGREIKSPHIVVFALEEYDVKKHPLYNFSEEFSELGVSFVFFGSYCENLPKNCSEIIKLDTSGCSVSSKNDGNAERKFTPDEINDFSISFIAERLAPIYTSGTSLAAKLPTDVSLFEILNILEPEDYGMPEKWKKADVSHSLSVPLGLDALGNVLRLDISERAHGPHGLIAGTTGSGKSELLSTYILSAALNYRPTELAFLLIDFKGGGMANQFEGLPHIVGIITDNDGEGTERSLRSIRSEIERRKRLFADENVSSIDGYIRKYRAGAAEIPLPHLVITVDEFAELKAEHPEFMRELISAARIGRSLGVHLILSTQKPAGQVSEQILSNSRFRICLKVASRDDSYEVLRTPLASEIKERGQAYLQVGNNEVFTLFQSAYTGASALSDKNGSAREFTVSEVSFSGVRTPVYVKKASDSNGERLTQLRAVIDYISDYVKTSGEPVPSPIFLSPLPENINFPTDDLSSDGAMDAEIGIIDDVEKQSQPVFRLDISDGNVLVVGESGSGKTELCKTFIRSLCSKNSPEQFGFMIIDLASKALMGMSRLRHCIGLATDPGESLRRAVEFICREISRRKTLAAGTEVMTPEVVIIDNLSEFREAVKEYESDAVYLLREGPSVGVYTLASDTSASGIGSKFMSCFPVRIALHLTDPGSYIGILGKTVPASKSVPGRGRVRVDGNMYLFQTYSPFGQDVSEEQFAEKINKAYPKPGPVKMPELPKSLSVEETASLGNPNDEKIAVGLDFETAEPVFIDLTEENIGIAAKSLGIKTAVIKTIVAGALKKSCKIKIIISDRADGQLNITGCKRVLTDDLGKELEALKESGERALIILNDRKAVEKYAGEIAALTASGNVFTVFSDIPGAGGFGSLEATRLVKNLRGYIIFDDLRRVDFIGSLRLTPSELRRYVRPAFASDGYILNGEGLERVRFSDPERGDGDD